MKCPYNVNYQIVTQSKMEYNDEGQMTINTDIQNQTVQMIECIKEECAAFEDGKCRYRG